MAKKKQKVLRIPTTQDLERIKQSLSGRYKGIYMFLWSTGLRVSEFTALNISDVINKNGTIMNTLTIVGKGKKERIVPLNDSAKESIKLLLEGRKYNSTDPLVRNYKGQRLTNRSVSRLVSCWGNKSDVGMRMSAHTLRHAFATTLVRDGVGYKQIQDLLGHSSIQTTLDIYAHNTEEDLINAINQFSVKVY